MPCYNFNADIVTQSVTKITVVQCVSASGYSECKYSYTMQFFSPLLSESGRKKTLKYWQLFTGNDWHSHRTRAASCFGWLTSRQSVYLNFFRQVKCWFFLCVNDGVWQAAVFERQSVAESRRTVNDRGTSGIQLTTVLFLAVFYISIFSSIVIRCDRARRCHRIFDR